MLHYSNDKVAKENNKLKLDNAALRAENQVLKRQLNYFENLFAKKTQTQQVTYASQFEHYSSASHTQSRSSGSALNAEQITQQKRPTAHEFRDNSRPPSACAANNNVLEEEAEISFVLERNVSASPTGNKLGIFSLALIMCVCCFSSFFAPHQTTAPVTTPAYFMASSSGGETFQSGSTLQETDNDGILSDDQVSQLLAEKETTTQE